MSGATTGALIAGTSAMVITQLEMATATTVVGTTDPIVTAKAAGIVRLLQQQGDTTEMGRNQLSRLRHAPVLQETTGGARIQPHLAFCLVIQAGIGIAEGNTNEMHRGLHGTLLDLRHRDALLMTGGVREQRLRRKPSLDPIAPDSDVVGGSGWFPCPAHTGISHTHTHTLYFYLTFRACAATTKKIVESVTPIAATLR